VWRIGHWSGPLDLAPSKLYGWVNRFDDSRRRFRSLYCSDSRHTAFREMLADFRTDAQALLDFERIFGGSARIPAGKVPAAWRREKRLAPCEIKIASGSLAALEDMDLRKQVERAIAATLVKHGFPHLDLGQVGGDNREVTQEAAAVLYDLGFAGVSFTSRLDGQACHALFEGRASLISTGREEPLCDDLPELIEVCAEFDLTLEPCR